MGINMDQLIKDLGISGRVISASSQEELASKLKEVFGTSGPHGPGCLCPEDERVMPTVEDAMELAHSALIGFASDMAASDRSAAHLKIQAANAWIRIAQVLQVEHAQQESAEIQRDVTRAEILRQEARLAKRRPNLGLATTAELLGELLARFAVPTPNEAVRSDLEGILEALDKETLEYSTSKAAG